MTSLESMAAAQLAAFQRMPELNQLNPFYPSRCHVRFYEILVDNINHITCKQKLLHNVALNSSI